jgi:hypothetical protein
MAAGHDEVDDDRSELKDFHHVFKDIQEFSRHNMSYQRRNWRLLRGKIRFRTWTAGGNGACG